MPRSDGMLLAYLVTRQRPTSRPAVRRVLEESAADAPSLSAVGQSLIRAKVITPQEFLVCQALIEDAHRRCSACGRQFVVLPGPRPKRRRCTCGHWNGVPAAKGPLLSPNAPSSNQFPALPGGSSRRRTGHTSREVAIRQVTGHTSANHKIPEIPLEETAPAPELAPPKRIGRYRIIERVAEGGMGVIFRAREPQTRRIVALKLLRRGSSKEVEERFRREAQAVARLTHPAIVKVHDVGRDETLGQPFFTMDYIEGRELQELRAELGTQRLVEMIATVADGLHHAHERGIVHRDIKPQNIMVNAQGKPLVADFGLARDLGRSSLTEDGDLVGTPLFMAPEQLRGDTSGIDRRTDVYALGVVLYQMLTDELPLNAASFFELQKQIRDQVPRAPSDVKPGLSRELDGVVLKCLAKKPDDRYDTCADLAADLRRYLAGESVEARPTGAGVRAARKAWSRLRTPGGIAAVGFALLLLIFAGFVARSHAQQQREEQRLHALEAKRSHVLESLRKAHQACEAAELALASGQPDVAHTRANQAATLAREAGTEAAALGSDAPPNAIPQANTAEARAHRVQARALAQGTPEQQDQARELYRALVRENLSDLDLKLELGQLELAAGAVTRAGELFKDAVAQNSERLDAFYLRGEASRRAGQPQFAKFDFERALADPTRLGKIQPVWILVGHARAQLALGNPDRALRDLEKAQADAPQDPSVRLLRAEILDARGDRDEALSELDLASRAFPDDGRVQLAAGKAWARAGLYGRARAALDAALERSHTPEIFLARGRLRSLAGDTEWEDDVKTALERSDPRDPLYREVLLVQVRGLRGAGRLDQALEAGEVLLDDRGSKPELEALALEFAETLLARGHPPDVDRASRDLQRVISDAPRNVRALRGLAWAALIQQDYELAFVQTRHLLEVSSTDPAGLAFMVQTLNGQGRSDDLLTVEGPARHAQSVLLQRDVGLALEVGPPEQEALSALDLGRRDAARARADERRREALLERAERHLRRAVGLAPWLAATRVALAELLAQKGDDEAALAELDGGGTSIPVAGAVRLRGELLAKRGRYKAAAQAFGKALTNLSAAQDHPATRRARAELLMARANSYMELGLSAEALADLDRAVDIQPKQLEAYELRARLRSRSGDAEGADADQQQVFQLRKGYRTVYEEARRTAWREAHRSQHIAAIRALEPAFALVSPERDPNRMAELHMIRAYMRLRTFEIPAALIDLAAMLELQPRSIGNVYDELNAVFHKGQQALSIDLETVLRSVQSELHRQVAVDPEFLEGFLAFVGVEFGGRSEEGQLRPGLRALARYQDRNPSRAGAMLLDATLLLATGRTPEALRVLTAAQEQVEGLGFADYLMARVQASQGDLKGALRSLERAMSGGFLVYTRIENDPKLADLRADPRYGILIRLAKATSHLKATKRAETLRRERDANTRRELLDHVFSSSKAGLEFLKGLISDGPPRARSLAAELYLARARSESRLRQRHEARRDLAAALELSPTLLLDWTQISEACEALAPLTPSEFKPARPLGDEVVPTRARLGIAVVLALLSGEAVSEADLSQAEKALNARRELRVYWALIRDAQGHTQEAQSALIELSHDLTLAPLTAWFSARIHAARGELSEAFEALETARDGGLRGPVGQDDALKSLAREGRFARLFSASRQPLASWRAR